MNDERTNNDDQLNNEQDDVLAQLIRSAGRREGPSTEHHEQVFAAAQTALQAKRGQQTTQRHRRLALAASVCIAIAGSLLWLSPETGQAPQLKVARVTGMAEWRSASNAPWSAIESTETTLAANSELRTTGGSGLSLLLGNVSIRMAAETTIKMSSADELRLDHGKVYIDSGRDTGTTMQVITSAATAMDIGTQFEVLFINSAYRLRVREGQVQLASDYTDMGNADVNRASDEVLIGADGMVERKQIASDDPDWAWAENLAPTPEIDGEPLTVLLNWVERETGREIIFADPLVELQSRQIVMHGTVQNLAPLQALDVVLATTDLAAVTIDDGRIQIKAADSTN